MKPELVAFLTNAGIPLAAAVVAGALGRASLSQLLAALALGPALFSLSERMLLFFHPGPLQPSGLAPELAVAAAIATVLVLMWQRDKGILAVLGRTELSRRTFMSSLILALTFPFGLEVAVVILDETTHFPIETLVALAGTILTSISGALAVWSGLFWAEYFERRRQYIHGIEESNRRKSEFLANMSHELRTPLNAIIGFSEILADAKAGPLTPVQAEFLLNITRSGRHLQELIDDALDLSAIEAGRTRLRPEAVDVRDVVEEACAATRATAEDKRIGVGVDLDPDLGSVITDPVRLKQILINYLSNAIKYTDPDGRVDVRIRGSSDGRFRIEVADTGIGIAPRDFDRLFRPFEQLEMGAAKRHAGAGLGLALTKRIVEAQGGTVGFSSRPGEGSVFWAELPKEAE